MLTKTNDKLLQLLKPIKNKLFYQKLIITTGWITFISLLFSIAFLVISRFLPIAFYKEIAIFFLIFAFISSIIYSTLTRPEATLAAKAADKFGLEERIITALENENNSSPIANMQREETINLLIKKLGFILENIIIWNFSKQKTVVFLTAFLVFLSLLYIPNPMDSVIAEQRIIKENKDTALATLKEEIEKINENENISAEDKEEILNSLKELEDNLQKAESINEQLEELNKLENKLADINDREQASQERFKSFADSLAANNSTKDLAEALQSSNIEATKKELEELESELNKLSDEELKNLKELLNKEAEKWNEAAKQLQDPNAAQIAASLSEAANNLAIGNFSNAAQLLSQGVTQAMQQNTGSQQFSNQLSATSSILQQQSNLIANSNSDSTLGQLSQGNPNGNNSANGNNNNSNGNSGDGSGAGSNASGTSGSGTGTGTNGSGNGGNGSTGSSGSGNGTGAGTGSGAGLGSGSHLINVPTSRIDSDGTQGTVSGPLTGEGDESISMSGNGIISPGVSTPYETVFKDYQETAIQSLERSEIPADYYDVIKDYFISIEP